MREGERETEKIMCDIKHNSICAPSARLKTTFFHDLNNLASLLVKLKHRKWMWGKERCWIRNESCKDWTFVSHKHFIWVCCLCVCLSVLNYFLYQRLSTTNQASFFLPSFPFIFSLSLIAIFILGFMPGQLMNETNEWWCKQSKSHFCDLKASPKTSIITTTAAATTTGFGSICSRRLCSCCLACFCCVCLRIEALSLSLSLAFFLILY